MPGWIPPRLRSLLGPDIDSVTEGALGHLVGLAENDDLEFKQDLYPTTEGGAKETAYDIAALANAGGGLILIGVREDGAGVSTELVPVVTDGDPGLWLHQVLASRVSPPVVAHHRAVRSGQGSVHLVGVSPSTMEPHGVAVGDGALRFPIRIGTTRRWLSETELAIRYRRRFTATASRLEELESLHLEASRLAPEDETDDESWAWLLVALTPDVPGLLEVRRGLAEEWGTWVNALLDDFPSYRRAGVHATMGFRSVALHDRRDLNEPIFAVGGRLGVNGGGFLIFGYPGGRNMVGVGPEVIPIYDEHLLGDLVNAINILANHAVRSGGAGDAHVSGEILSPNRPMVLAEYRSRFPGELRDTRTVQATTGRSLHTVPLASSTVPGEPLLSAARLVAADLTTAFGQAEPQQVTRDSRLVRNRFQRDWQDWLEDWATGANVDVIDDIPPANDGG